MVEFNLGDEFITIKPIPTRYCIIPKGVKLEINEISNSEYNGDGEAEPYKVCFDYDVEVDGEYVSPSEWLTEHTLLNSCTPYDCTIKTI